MNAVASGSAQAREHLARNLRRVLLATLVLLLVPLVAMQLTHEVNWGPLDFAAAFVLLGGTGSLFVLAASRLKSALQRACAGAGLLLLLLLAWAELAVGIFGSPLAGS